jgi:hypothetical protein
MPEGNVDSYLTDLYEFLMKCSAEQFVELYRRTLGDAIHLDASALADNARMKEAKLEYFSEISLYEKDELGRIMNVAEQIVSRGGADR